MSTSQYDFAAIEPKWQRFWAERGTFTTLGPGDEGFDPTRGKFYALDMFPYPSGVGLHVGHPLGYIATDIFARYKRMRGFNVLHSMGFDAFGLPAEQFAVEHGVHPRITTERNIQQMVRQLKALGLGHDWGRSFATTDVEYYKWTQWIFLRLYHSYFDEATNKAMPIDDLLRRLINEELYVNYDGKLVPPPAEGLEGIEGDPVGARKWHELTDDERNAVIDDHRLAYLAEVAVNWCPALGTVLANEEVTNDGRSERGNHPVYKRPLRQWMLRITAYAERLIDDLKLIDWPEPIRIMQRNWIGRSEGAMVDFAIDGGRDVVRVFTTRPDTLFGATYMVLAPEHPLIEQITPAERLPEVVAYQQTAAGRSDVDRMAEAKTKTGAFTGAYAINPANGQRIPIWIADYVMMGYGTGAIMAVPAHDQRDFEFARAFGLPIRPVVMPTEDWFEAHRPASQSLEQLRDRYVHDPTVIDEAFTGHGQAINSANEVVSLNGRPTAEAKQVITQWLVEAGLGRAEVQYKLRDWLFSRQRYWGEPFPILHELNERGERTGRIRAVDEADLPVALPEMEDFSPEASDNPDAPPRPPLSRAPQSWRIVEIDGVRYERELNTMPQWAGSCWYYLRYLDPRNSEQFCDPARERYWMQPNGVDLYVGGAEHAVLHLLYSRFWHKVLYDLGHVSTPEPFGKLFNQGYIQAYSYQDERGIYVEAAKVEERDGQYFYEGKPVTRSLGKMGKSLKNAVSPDEICAEYGCDTLRLYEMYLGPLDASKPWNTRDIIGVHRFLQRVWRNLVAQDDTLKIVDAPPTDEQLRLLHRTIKRVTDDMERMSFNTAIAALIEMNNELVGLEAVPRQVAVPFTLMLAPLAPHIAEELWHRLGHVDSLAYHDWPAHDEKHLVEHTVELAVQIMGKVRGRITVPADANSRQIEHAATNDEKIAAQLEGKTVHKIIVVPGKLVNIVAN